ncbi:hypothetical protein F0562_001784 [Nyssa sinensis]|uniref:Bifunctional inhibitor/plant lipid transfer protein/seed storage helical domain-containing protein n=1 Tax=Nyssa sinensis TaxID=561372 RepID=A0A5J5C7Z2_9ASTE|nr:hypothetical protein F0562_001784 [Nyssa sinensis]
MATTTITARRLLVLVAVLFLTTLPEGTAESPPFPAAAPSPSLGCTTYLVNTSDCLTYVEAGSNLTKPDKGCCPELAGLVESHPICLCLLLGHTDSIGIPIDLNKALKLPSVCDITTPPITLCSVAGYPIGAPKSSKGHISSDVMPPAAAHTASENDDNGTSRIAFSHVSFAFALGIAILTALF